MHTLERELAGSIGAPAAHAMRVRVLGGSSLSVEDLMAVTNGTAQMLEHSTRQKAQQEELSRNATQMREANDKLTQISVQKDAFLNQSSHELGTPKTSICVLSKILMDAGSTRSSS